MFKTKNKILSQVQGVTDFFEKEANDYFDAYNVNSSAAHSFNVRRQRVCELLNKCRGKRILDIGCGPGIMIEHLFNNNGLEFFGVDISQAMINDCKKRFGHVKSAYFSVGKVEKLEFPDSFFDIIIAMGLVEYLDDDQAAFEEMTRVLKPGGEIIITFPNRTSPYRIWCKYVYRTVTNVMKKIIRKKTVIKIIHREYKEKDIDNLLKPYHLTVTDIVYYNFKLFLSPLDNLLPSINILLSKKLESLCRGRFRKLGTGFIVKAVKD